MTEQKQYTIKELRKSLNEQQQRFCEAKLFNNNVQAYMIAYPECEYKSASASANRLLEDVRIIQLIELLKLNIEDVTGVSKIRNVFELSKIAYSSIAHLHNTWIELKDFESLTDEQKEAIESIDTKIELRFEYDLESESKKPIEVKYIKIKLYSKLAAIESINKMMGYNEAEKLDISGKMNIISLGSGKKPD